MEFNKLFAHILFLLVFLPALGTATFHIDSLNNAIEESQDQLEQSTDKLTDFGETEASGVLLPTTDAFSQEIQDLRNQVPLEIPANSYLLLSRDGTYLVLSSEMKETGAYTIEGKSLPSINFRERTYATILAQNMRDQPSERVTAEQIASNPAEYRYKEVIVDGTLKEAGFSLDTDIEFSSSSTFGAISTRPPIERDIVGNLRDKAESIVEQPDWQTLEEVFGFGETRIPVVDLNNRYWSNSEVTIHGIVLTPDDILQVKEFLSPEGREIVRQLESNSMIYVEDVDYNSQPQSIAEIHETRIGENVEFTGYGFVQSVSLQDVAVAATSMPIPVDATFRAGVFWHENNPLENIIGVGVTSEPIPREAIISGGNYAVSGKVVSAKTLDESLPESKSIVLLHDLDRQFAIQNIFSEYPELEGKRNLVQNIVEGEDVELPREDSEHSAPQDDGELETETGITGQITQDDTDSEESGEDGTSSSTDNAPDEDGSDVEVLIRETLSTILNGVFGLLR